MSRSERATASGWIGSALEFYDFFIYATAASLVFPQLFFPSDNPTVAIVASLATYAVGLLPTYDQVGLLAPVLLVALRLAQGFAVAGEICAASSMILEHAPFGRR